MKSAKRIESVQSPVIPLIGQWIAEHPGTISLGQGVVHYPPPPAVRRAVAEALIDEPRIDRYGSVRGIEELLERIQTKVRCENQLSLEEQTVLCTAGSNMGFLNAVLAIADVGDEIILPCPYYFNHQMAIELAGCKAVSVPTDADYQLDLSAIQTAMSPRTRAVVTVSPNNPTGAVYSQAALTRVNQLCQRHPCYHISDEAYEVFTFNGTSHFSPASLAESAGHTISLFSLSKAYGMAGWRCGYMILPKHLEADMKKVQDTNLICPPIICQVAAAAALEVGSGWCREQIQPFRAVREHVLDELTDLSAGCRVPRSDGAFYVLLQLDTQLADIELVHTLIRDFGVAVLPSSTFGNPQGCGVRISYGSLQAATVQAGMERLKRGLRSLL